MSDPFSSRYDAIPYRHGAVPHSHPARIGAIARLFGMRVASPDRCRVLELGCAEGMNLLPLAERLPQSQFTGVDFSSAQIAVADEARRLVGIANANFVCADLRQFEAEPEAFDYIIAHGVYSWVPDDVKERVLAICAKSLAPGGVAYVSYNTLPGWGLLGGLRKFMLAETASANDPASQLDRSRRVLDVLAQCLSAQPGGYAEMMREAVADMLAKSPALLFHDELGAVNDPSTFLDFTAHAARHGLHFLAEAHYASMPFEHVPAPMRSALAALGPDFLREQQFMDVLFQRWLRSSLLCRAEPTRTADASAICECALGLRLRPASASANLQPGVPMRFTGANGLALDFDGAFEKAFLSALAEAASARVPFADACERALGFLDRVGLPQPADTAEICAKLLHLFSIDALDLVLTGGGEWLRERTPAGPSALMLHQARGEFSVTNRWHELVALTSEGRGAIVGEIHPANVTALRRTGLLV